MKLEDISFLTQGPQSVCPQLGSKRGIFVSILNYCEHLRQFMSVILEFKLSLIYIYLFNHYQYHPTDFLALS